MTTKDLESLLKQLARPIDRQLNPRLEIDQERKVGFLLCAFEFETTAFAFLSNAQPDGLEKALRELLVRFRAEGILVELPGGDA